MEFEAPKAFTDLLPADLRAYAVYILGGSLCIAGLIVMLVLVAVVKLLFGRKKKVGDPKDLTENLTEYPDLKRPSSGDRQLRAEGVPVRIRLIVVAPAGTASEIDVDELAEILEKVLPGLGEIYKNDKPRVKVWPTQVSYQGFATHFHKNMKTGAKEGELSRWVLVAGRAKLGKQQIMLGLGMQTIKPNTVGRRTVDSHEWANVLRVRVKD
jgi:hypothetical protein